MRCWDTKYWVVGIQTVGGWVTNCLGVGIQTVGVSLYNRLVSQDTNCWGVLIQSVGVSGFKKTVSMSGNKLLGCKGTIFKGVGTQTVLDCHGVRIQPVELLGYKLSRGHDTNFHRVSKQAEEVSHTKCWVIIIETVGVSICNCVGVRIQRVGILGCKLLGCWDTIYWGAGI